MKTLLKTLLLITLTLTFVHCDQIKSLIGQKDEPTPSTTETTKDAPKVEKSVSSTTIVTTTTEPASMYVVGEKVLVHWGKKWWSAKILKAEKNRWLITYDGYNSSWDEWVGPDRMKKK